VKAICCEKYETHCRSRVGTPTQIQCLGNFCHLRRLISSITRGEKYGGLFSAQCQKFKYVMDHIGQAPGFLSLYAFPPKEDLGYEAGIDRCMQRIRHVHANIPHEYCQDHYSQIGRRERLFCLVSAREGFLSQIENTVGLGLDLEQQDSRSRDISMCSHNQYARPYHHHQGKSKKKARLV